MLTVGHKKKTQQHEHLFPKAFDFIKATQLSDGSWSGNSSELDGIINTLAGLLALQVHQHTLDHGDSDLKSSCAKAEASLNHMLQNWDIKGSDRVGFEVLIPNLLLSLEKHGVQFEFPARKELLLLSSKKIQKLKPGLASHRPNTLIHSLEAFTGNFDFDLVKHHRSPEGSMLGSPSSTAAYLMHTSSWDSQAEQYLVGVEKYYLSEKGSGGFPSAFPTSVFEIAWVLSILFEGNFNERTFTTHDLRYLKSALQATLQNGSGLTGFASNFLPDADDTAKANTVLSLLGESPSLEAMINEFEKPSSFATYHGERNPSVSTNCNVLACLLRSGDIAKHVLSIEKCTQFITSMWISGQIRDKWNTSEHYPMMLAAQSLSLLLTKLKHVESTEVKGIFSTSLKRRILVVLQQIYQGTIDSQQPNGSWDDKREVTAYAILTLAPLLNLIKPDESPNLDLAVFQSGKQFLLSCKDKWSQGEYLWIEKTSYSLSNVAQAYCLAACNIKATEYSETITTVRLPKSMTKLKCFFEKLPMFSGQHDEMMRGSLIESFRIYPLLERCHDIVFPPLSKASDTEYLRYIPITWISCKNLGSRNIEDDILFDMMVVSMLDYQVDGYMEFVLQEKFQDNLDALGLVIRDLFNGTSRKKSRPATQLFQGNNVSSHLHRDDILGTASNSPPVEADCRSYLNGTFGDVSAVLNKLIIYVLQHPKVLACPLSLQNWLKIELKAFLLSHVQQMKDSAKLPSESSSIDESWGMKQDDATFFGWTHSTGGETTSCLFSFVFFLCLTYIPESRNLLCVQTRYLLEDAAHHLAAMCRHQNDFGSVSRDRKERNFNSINFAEFRGFREESEQGNWHCIEESQKRVLMNIAGYERQCLGATLSELEARTDKSFMDKLRLFVDVTELYGQIYIARDISPRNNQG
ncbi:Terpenoid cyclase/Protein prenyltransferase [Glarea lozoyensis ATCC 20868]|uniref:Terpenoid cyclase/Protein prenyltransferase n=1 Tax=Glarea lozoyensis (strain ATCC 20868 / MF5171) TaxID=1116229 RepID=S3DI56_GLAL2|nr:Terpenoid cyclase/Protein prenyltransferase [Glarea lozoyensis ATCC 20868]EPE31716.1 Terpenoid cyclase/Protein prenyltransferase [Glarea lozoyensis ATCC 20868]